MSIVLLIFVILLGVMFLVSEITEMKRLARNRQESQEAADKLLATARQAADDLLKVAQAAAKDILDTAHRAAPELLATAQAAAQDILDAAQTLLDAKE